MLGLLYLGMRYLPTYAIVSSAVDSQVASPVPFDQNAPGVDTMTIRTQSDLLGVLMGTSTVILLIIVAFGAVLSWFVAGRLLRPVQALTAAARQAATGSLHHRVGLTGPDDEFVELSKTFDDMLSRLEHSFEAYRRFASNASHELRTPLTTTKAVLDLARAWPEQVNVDALLTKLQTANDQSIGTVEAILDLADSNHIVPDPDPIRLDHVLARVCAAAQSEARTLSVSLSFEAAQNAFVMANGDMIHILFNNLLQNAIRHNVSGGTVSVQVRASSREHYVTIRNTGPIVPEASLPLLTEPFYRDRGRLASSTLQRSHGLGLAISRNIVDAHSGSMQLTANPSGGLTIDVRLPTAIVGPSGTTQAKESVSTPSTPSQRRLG